MPWPSLTKPILGLKQTNGIWTSGEIGSTISSNRSPLLSDWAASHQPLEIQGCFIRRKTSNELESIMSTIWLTRSISCSRKRRSRRGCKSWPGLDERAKRLGRWWWERISRRVPSRRVTRLIGSLMCKRGLKVDQAPVMRDIPETSLTLPCCRQIWANPIEVSPISTPNWTS